MCNLSPSFRFSSSYAYYSERVCKEFKKSNKGWFGTHPGLKTSRNCCYKGRDKGRQWSLGPKKIVEYKFRYRIAAMASGTETESKGRGHVNKSTLNSPFPHSPDELKAENRGALGQGLLVSVRHIYQGHAFSEINFFPWVSEVSMTLGCRIYAALGSQDWAEQLKGGRRECKGMSVANAKRMASQLPNKHLHKMTRPWEITPTLTIGVEDAFAEGQGAQSPQRRWLRFPQGEAVSLAKWAQENLPETCFYEPDFPKCFVTTQSTHFCASVISGGDLQVGGASP